MNQADLTSLLEKDDGLNENLGLDYAELAPEKVIIKMPIDTRHCQPLGYLHGGANLVLAESVATIGGWFNCPPGKVAFGSEINASHVRPKRSGTLTGIGTPVHKGHGSQVWEVKIYDEDEKLVCVSRCTLAIVDAPE